MLLAFNSVCHQASAPIRHLRDVNPYVAAALAEKQAQHLLQLPREHAPVRHDFQTCTAGTSSFGMSGVNAHMLLSAPTDTPIMPHHEVRSCSCPFCPSALLPVDRELSDHAHHSTTSTALCTPALKLSLYSMHVQDFLLQRRRYWCAPEPHSLLLSFDRKLGTCVFQSNLHHADLAYLHEHQVMIALRAMPLHALPYLNVAKALVFAQHMTNLKISVKSAAIPGCAHSDSHDAGQLQEPGPRSSTLAAGSCSPSQPAGQQLIWQGSGRPCLGAGHTASTQAPAADRAMHPVVSALPRCCRS